jgi:sugar lactone lactonase YvrE
VDSRDHLGEGPWWDAERAELLWVDILGRRVRRSTLDGLESPPLATPSEVGFAVRDADGRIVAGLSDGLAVAGPEGEQWSTIWSGDYDATRLRINDGKTDRRGRLWFGTMDREERDPVGALVSSEAGTATPRVVHVTISNGLGWSPDGARFYYTDSGARSIRVFEVAEDGGLTGGSVFATDPAEYLPDGLTVDGEGFVWSAKWDGGRVVRYSPDGRVDRVLELPVAKPTSVAFAGPRLDTLVITSARMSDADGALAGAVLLVDPGVTGIAERPADTALL